MAYDSAQLLALETVLRLGAFDLAAAELSVTPSAVSQRIRALEDQVGSPLVLRTTPARPTQAGARLARHAREMSLLEATLAHDLGGDLRPGRARIVLNADSLDTWAIPALASVEMLFDIVVADETISTQHLRSGDASAVVSSQSRPVQGCDVYPLGSMDYVATCAPGFYDRHFASGVNANTLAKAPMLDFSGHDLLQRNWLASVAGKRLTPPTHYLPSTQGFVLAGVCGLGWGLNPKLLVEADLQRGALRPLMPDQIYSVPLYWHVHSLVAPALTPLTRAIRKAARTHLSATAPATDT